jgi:hypothetical protein
MLARSGRLPASRDFAYEVKWDGFRAIVSAEGATTPVGRALRLASSLLCERKRWLEPYCAGSSSGAFYPGGRPQPDSHASEMNETG